MIAWTAIRYQAESSGSVAVSALSGTLSVAETDALGTAGGCPLPVRARYSTGSVT